MFKSLKLYTEGIFDIDSLCATLVEFGYTRQQAAVQEGDFARRGSIIDVFAYTFELPIRIDFHSDTVISIKTYNPADGSVLWEHRMAIVLPVKRVTRIRDSVLTAELPLEAFVDIGIGDFVVHSDHGIGRFLGLHKLNNNGALKDHLVIEYERQEKLYVPVENLHLVQKYVAFGSRRPKVNRLGTKEWQRAKHKALTGIQKMAWELLSVSAMRTGASGFAYGPDTDWQKQFEATFPYIETPDQSKVIADVKQEMESGRLMDRLLCGDVGYGKTEVAMRAAFKAVMNSKQVVYLVPTTILAEQHYQNFSSRLKDFPFRVEMLSRFKTRREQQEIIQDLQSGAVDVVIGTHRLLSADVRFKDLGLAVIDEEQRFGVRAKEKLKQIRLTTDVLTLTATPIPRTLYMSLMGVKELSVLNTPPQNRLPIKTVVVEYDQDLIAQAIRRELHRKGQVFFLHNRIQDIAKIKERLVRILPAGVRIAVGHGQMRARELEDVMIAFLRNQTDVLLCTMIIESGIDIPNANTIIVNNAQAFGLSDLHQLRGRVGRFNKPAYAYFLLPRDAALDSGAQKRMDALKEYSDLGAGFKIAMQDLELRGAGNLLGGEQHGFIAAVGFDLYCRLLREAITTFRKLGISYGERN